MNRKEIYVFMFYILLTTVCMIISLFLFAKYNLNLWGGISLGCYVGFIISFILWKFYGRRAVAAP